MEALIELKNRLLSLEAMLPIWLQEIFNEIKATVEDQNIFQLREGQRADGTFLPDYSPRSVNQFGKPPGPMKLYDQGDFYRGITLKVMANGIELTGLDIKTEMLQLRYGDNIIGLSEESIDILMNDYVKPLLEEKLRDYLGVDIRLAA